MQWKQVQSAGVCPVEIPLNIFHIILSIIVYVAIIHVQH